MCLRAGLIACLLAGADLGLAQPVSSEAVGAVAVEAVANDRAGFGGFCPVALHDAKRWLRGAREHQATFDGITYRCCDAEALAAFQADPVSYAPALGGDDLVEYARTGRRVAGDLALGARHLDRHCFFASEANKQAFLANPAQFANADLANGGVCVVCELDLNARVAGAARFTAIRGGLRYVFAGEQQRQAFLADPVRYTRPGLR